MVKALESRKKSDLVFRRVNGRIIPIKSRKKQFAEGAGLAIAGAVAGASAGDVAARATKEAAKFRTNANLYSKKAEMLIKRIRRGKSTAEKLEQVGQIRFSFKVNPKFKSEAFEKIALKNALRSKGFTNLKKGLKLGGLATSAALLGTGFKKLYASTTGEKADTKQELISGAAGAGATFALSSAYSHRLLGGGKKNLAKAIKFGIRAAKFKLRMK